MSTINGIISIRLERTKEEFRVFMFIFMGYFVLSACYLMGFMFDIYIYIEEY